MASEDERSTSSYSGRFDNAQADERAQDKSDAIALPAHVDLPAPGPGPCDACDAPCRSACPVDALGPDGYDVAACHAYLDTDPGRDCMELGCKARRACPLSAASGRVPAQSAYHMRQFHK